MDGDEICDSLDISGTSHVLSPLDSVPNRRPTTPAKKEGDPDAVTPARESYLLPTQDDEPMQYEEVDDVPSLDKVIKAPSPSPSPANSPLKMHTY